MQPPAAGRAQALWQHAARDAAVVPQSAHPDLNSPFSFWKDGHIPDGQTGGMWAPSRAVAVHGHRCSHGSREPPCASAGPSRGCLAKEQVWAAHSFSLSWLRHTCQKLSYSGKSKKICVHDTYRGAHACVVCGARKCAKALGYKLHLHAVGACLQDFGAAVPKVSFAGVQSQPGEA